MTRPVFPHDPEIEIEYARCVGESGHGFPLHGYSVCINFTIECLSHGDSVVVRAGGSGFVFERVEPEFQVIKEMEAAPINDWSGLSLVFGSEENRGAEEPLEAFDEAAIVRAIFGKMEEVEHLGGRIEMKLTGFLPDSKCSHPDRDEAILAKREAKVWMGDDVKKKFAIAATMDDLAGRRTA